VLEHGYCKSLYVTDPNGMILEFTHDDPRAEPLDADRRAAAHGELKRWLAGDHHNNNPFRAEEAA
jgi:catechol-2,3-dioxygenase